MHTQASVCGTNSPEIKDNQSLIAVVLTCADIAQSMDIKI
jgi:hypothetical protein